MAIIFHDETSKTFACESGKQLVLHLCLEEIKLHIKVLINLKHQIEVLSLKEFVVNKNFGIWGLGFLCFGRVGGVFSVYFERC